MQSIKTIAIITAVGVLLTAGSVLANNSANTTDSTRKKPFISAVKRQTFEEQVAAKVTAGKITQEEADKLIANHEAKKAEMLENAKAKVEEQLAAGKITQEQADKMLANIAEGKMPFMQGGQNGKQQGMQKGEWDGKTFEERIAAKVTAGEITQEEADKLIADCEAKKAEMLENAKAKVEEQLAAGKITQEQADKMLANIAEGKMPFMQGRPNGKQQGMQKGVWDGKTFEERIAAKVTAGEITQEEADKLIADREAKKAEMLENAKAKVEEQLASGKITQEQADKMLAEIAEGKMPFRAHMGGADKFAKRADGCTAAEAPADTTTDA